MKDIENYPFRCYCRKQSGKAGAPTLVALVLGALLVVRLGGPLWTAWAPEAVEGEAAAAGTELAAAGEPDLAALQSLHLFEPSGALVAADSAPVLNTSLNLRLEGVILAGDPDASLAVIASGAERGTYRGGETLPAGANIRVESIARDHVVIDNRGQREVLWLFGGSNAAPADAGTTTAAGNPQPVLPPGVDERVLRTAARLAEIISVSPEQSNGNLVGYRLAPGARLKDFVNLGFQEGDIVTAVNGIALNDVANLPKLYGLMDGASEVSFSLLRNGSPLALKVTLTPELSTR